MGQHVFINNQQARTGGVLGSVVQFYIKQFYKLLL